MCARVCEVCAGGLLFHTVDTVTPLQQRSGTTIWNNLPIKLNQLIIYIQETVKNAFFNINI